MGLRLKQGISKLFRLLLLVLFLGYYSGITLFPHAHVINGITIIHSHPFNSGGGNNSSNLPHSGKELQLIHHLSEFLSTAVSVAFISLIIKSLLVEDLVHSTKEGYAEPGGNRTNSLRAPPVKCFNLA